MSEQSSNVSAVERVWWDLVKPLQDPNQDLTNTIRTISFLLSAFFLVASVIHNFAIILSNICNRHRMSVGYFRLLIVYCLLHIAFQVTVCYVESEKTLLPLVVDAKDDDTLVWLAKYSPIISRAALATIFLLVSTLTIERFLASTVGSGVVGICLQIFTCLLGLSAPAILASFHILTQEYPTNNLQTHSYSELWFGLEVGIYIILPLLILTIFGTVNYCKISISSRLMPRSEVTAVKTNIGLVILTTMAIFLFLVLECCILWKEQLLARQHDNSQAVKEMLEIIEVTSLCVGMGLNFVQFIAPISCLFIGSSCCIPCCCPSINQLEETRYEPVRMIPDHVSL